MDDGRVARVAPKVESKLRKAIEGAAARLGGSGLRLYSGNYVDLVIAAESARGTVTLVAGTHTANFPYWGTEPWDQCLLLVGDEGFVYQHRVQGAHLSIDFDVEAPAGTGVIRFKGEMRRARDGKPAQIELDLPIAFLKFPVRHLGEAYNFLEIEGLIGMRWNPWDLRGEGGRLRIGGEDVALSGLRGSAERGVLTNLRAEEFAIEYDYVALAKPGARGFGIIQFVSHALHLEILLGRVLDAYLVASASTAITVEGGRLEEGNPRGAYLPPQDDPSVFLYEDVVDLGPARLRRQMVRSRDGSGEPIYGLREIFEEKAQLLPWWARRRVLAALCAGGLLAFTVLFVLLR